VNVGGVKWGMGVLRPIVSSLVAIMTVGDINR